MREGKREISLRRKSRKGRERLPKAFKEQWPTSSTRPKPPTPRVSMMLKSDSFRLAKKAASASYLDFLMRKNGNLLEVQTRVPRTTVAGWQDCGTGFTCLHSILLLESVFSHTHTVFGPTGAAKHRFALAFFFQRRKIQSTHCMPVLRLINPVIKSKLHLGLFLRVFLWARIVCVVLLWFCLGFFGFAWFWFGRSDFGRQFLISFPYPQAGSGSYKYLLKAARSLRSLKWNHSQVLRKQVRKAEGWCANACNGWSQKHIRIPKKCLPFVYVYPLTLSWQSQRLYGCKFLIWVMGKAWTGLPRSNYAHMQIWHMRVCQMQNKHLLMRQVNMSCLKYLLVKGPAIFRKGRKAKRWRWSSHSRKSGQGVIQLSQK